MADASRRPFDYDEVLRPGRKRSLRRGPELVGHALGVAWRAAPRQTAAFAVLQVGAGIGLAVQLLAARALLSELLTSPAPERIGAVLPELAVLACVGALVSAAAVARVEQQRLLSELVAVHATGQVIEVAAQVELLAFDDPTFHDRLQRARLNAVVRPVQMTVGVLGILSSSIAMAGIGIALLLVEPVFLLFILFAFAPVWVVATRSGSAVYEFSVAQTPRDRQRAYLFQLLTDKPNAAEVRAYGLADHLRRRHDRLMHEKLTDLRRLVRARLRSGLIAAAVTAVLTAATLAVLVWLVTSERMTTAEAGTAAVALVLLSSRLQALAAAAGAVFESSLFLDDVRSFTAPAVAPQPRAGGASSRTGWHELVAEDVTFSYPSRDAPSLRGVTVRLRAGEVVALVGANGSGKTTLAKVLAGLYRPTTGRVLADGADRAEDDPGSVLDGVAVVLQDFVRYHLPVRDNIGLGRADDLDDDQRLVAAARLSGADAAIDSLPLGYDTPLGPEFLGGSDLSGGQWQRIALARAFFRDAPLLILDEPTAALDARAEAALFESVRRLQRGRTVLLISHRFSSVKSADRIYVLDQGLVVEEGSHGELMAAAGLYAELFTLQASAFRDDA